MLQRIEVRGGMTLVQNQQGLIFGSEGNVAQADRVIQHSCAQRIARQNQVAPGAIADGQCKIPIEKGQTLQTVFAIGGPYQRIVQIWTRFMLTVREPVTQFNAVEQGGIRHQRYFLAVRTFPCVIVCPFPEINTRCRAPFR